MSTGRFSSFAIATVAVAALAASQFAAPTVLASPSALTAQHPWAQGTCSEATIENPKDGDILAGQVAVFGSARIDDFNFFKLEVAPQTSPGSWSAVSSVINTPVVRGLLDVWNTTQFTDGQYMLKLTVVDPIGQEVCSYVVAGLYVGNSATPTASPTVTPEVSSTTTPTFALDLQPTAEPTVAATVVPIIPIAPEDSERVTAHVAETLMTDALGAFVRGFLIAAACAACVLAVMAFRRL